MNEPFDDFDKQLDQLFNRLRENTAGPEDIKELEQVLHSDPALRQRYRARVRMEEELSAHFEQPAELTLPFEPAEKQPWYKNTFVALVGIAAVIAVIATTGIVNNQNPTPNEDSIARVAPVATLEGANTGSWDIPPTLAEGARVTPGEVRLASGVASFRFDSGALVILEGPATLVIETPMKARLIDGKALVEAPESAHGFVIKLPYGETVDLGTRFSVSVKDDTSTCEVLEGSVLMRHEVTNKEENLTDGQVMTLNRAGLTPLSYNPSMKFAPNRQEPLVLRNSEEVTVVSSNLRDGYVDARMLLVKMEPNSFMQRRALFNINHSDIQGSTIESARLNLNLVPSGIGFAAYLPETITFAVYGVTDESREAWVFTHPKWEEAPGYVAGDESAVNSSEVTLLGKFKINRGRQNGKCMIETQELLTFLRNDTTGTSGFIIVRETYATGENSLVHAFASSQHPEISGPSLELILVK
jgi:hypothetical protein